MAFDLKSSSLNFFRSVPDDIESHPPLLSSLQGFETSLILVSLGRFPPALISCVSAWESVIKAKYAISPLDYTDLADLLTKICERFPRLKTFDKDEVARCRLTRNNLVHFGSSPKDDELSAKLLLSIGYPFLFALYRECFDMWFNWRELRPTLGSFVEMRGDPDSSKVSLNPDWSEPLCDALRRYRDFPALRKPDRCTFLFKRFGFLARTGLKDSALTRSEQVLLDSGADGGQYKDFSDRVEALQYELSEPNWVFNCPVCQATGAYVSEVDDTYLSGLNRVVLLRGYCVECQFGNGADDAALANEILETSRSEALPEILKAYGLAKK